MFLLKWKFSCSSTPITHLVGARTRRTRNRPGTCRTVWLRWRSLFWWGTRLSALPCGSPSWETAAIYKRKRQTTRLERGDPVAVTRQERDRRPSTYIVTPMTRELSGNRNHVQHAVNKNMVLRKISGSPDSGELSKTELRSS